jgi:hypothetical protein
MKLSGFTFVRNAIKHDYQIEESIRSALPIVDEYVVNVGRSEDGTLELVRSIDSPKIKIIETVWDDNLRTDGRLFGMQQDIALANCTGDWAFLLQADEVVHEHDLPVITDALRRYHDRPDVLGLVFRVLHFKGDYWSVDPWMYHWATRIIRRRPNIHSATDGYDFEIDGRPDVLKNHPESLRIKARIFHYGYARDSSALREKRRYQLRRHEGERWTEDEMDALAEIEAKFPTYDVLKDYRGSHPKVMERRVLAASRLKPRRSRWLNPRFYQEVWKHGFRG